MKKFFIILFSLCSILCLCLGLTACGGEIPEDQMVIRDHVLINVKEGRHRTFGDKLTIPDTVIGIKENAFKDCPQLKTVIVPDTVEYIEAGAFRDCKKLTNITLPFLGLRKELPRASKESLFGYIFGSTEYDQSVEITQKYQAEGGSVIYYLPKSLENVTITGGDLGYGAFYNCEGIEELTISEKVGDIDLQAFYGVTNLQKLTAPMKVMPYISDKTHITDLILVGYGKISEGEFNDFSQLKTLSVDHETIGDRAFRNFSNLESVILRNTSSLGEEAFAGCPNLKTVKLGSVSAMGAKAFAGCSKLEEVELSNNLDTVEAGTFKQCNISEISLTKNIRYIRAGAFQDCSKLSKVTIGSAVEMIEQNAFQGCEKLSTAEFIQKSNWSVYLENEDDTKTSISFGNAKEAAGFLKNQYCDYIWIRT